MISETTRQARSREAVGIANHVIGVCRRMGARRTRHFLTRFACKPMSFYRWFSFLAAFQRRHGLGWPHDDLFRQKPYRFFALRLPARRGFELLAGHFELAATGLSRARLEAAWSGQAIAIGVVGGRRDAYALTMRLCVHSGTGHEGAFSIILTRQSDRLDLLRMSFILYPLGDSRYTVAIGGLQGNRRPGAKRAVIEATRDMGGLRPKDAVLLVVEGIAVGGDTDHFLGVSDARHVINFRARRKRAGKLADMDTYWIDRGGRQGGEFGFAIPVRNGVIAEQPARRDMSKAQFLEIGRTLFCRRADPHQLESS